MDEELSQVSVAMLRNAYPFGLAACRDLSRNEAKPCREITSLAKARVRAYCGNQGGRDGRTDTGFLHQAKHARVILGELLDLHIQGRHASFDLIHLGGHVGQHLDDAR